MKVHDLEYNIVARNGTWNVSQLVDVKSNGVVAWFLSHSDVNPCDDLTKLICVSGSPYEPNSGSSMNNDDTANEGVFVINRYDWGFYDAPCFKFLGEDAPEHENVEYVHDSISISVVDHSEAKATVFPWREQTSSERQSWDYTTWLYIPDAEYMFGRFGFDDENVAARSFLFFSAYTNFARTNVCWNTAGTTFGRPKRRMITSSVHSWRLTNSEKFQGVDVLPWL